MGTEGSAHPQSREGIVPDRSPGDYLPHTAGLPPTSGPCMGPSALLFRFPDRPHSPAFTSRDLRTHLWPQVPPFRREGAQPVLFWTVALSPSSHGEALPLDPTVSSLRRCVHVYVASV